MATTGITQFAWTFQPPHAKTFPPKRGQDIIVQHLHFLSLVHAARPDQPGPHDLSLWLSPGRFGLGLGLGQEKTRQGKTRLDKARQGDKAFKKKRRELRAIFLNGLSSCLVLSRLV